MIQTNVGAYVKAALALAPVQIVAGGAGDNVAQNGPAVDRQGFLSAVLAVPIQATLAQAATLTINAKLQDSADGATGWTDFAGPTSNLVLTGGAGGSTESGQLELNINLRGARRYVRAVATGDLSAATVDTARFGASIVLGGADSKPV